LDNYTLKLLLLTYKVNNWYENFFLMFTLLKKIEGHFIVHKKLTLTFSCTFWKTGSIHIISVPYHSANYEVSRPMAQRLLKEAGIY
jgi:hypothetical protein